MKGLLMIDIVTYKSDFYHNGHSQQRDRLLIKIYGEEWLREQKSKGYFGGDWPSDVVGTPKPEPSGYLDSDGSLVTVGNVIELSSPEDLKD